MFLAIIIGNHIKKSFFCKKYRTMDHFRRTKIKDLLKNPELKGIGNQVTVKGWVRTKRGNKNVLCISLRSRPHPI